MAILTVLRDKVNHWWLLLAAGFMLIGLGIWVLISPFISYLYIAFIFVALAFAAGIFEIFFSIINRKNLSDWITFLVGGMLDMVIATYVFSDPMILMFFLPPVMGIWLLMKFIIFIRNMAIFQKYKTVNWWLLLVLVIVVLYFSQKVVTKYSVEMIDVMALTGVGFILAGAFRIYLSLKIRKLY